MSPLFRKLIKIDDRSRYGVYGWIRKAEMDIKIGNIPLIIQSICLLYFYEEEMFDVINKHVQSSDNKKCITKMKINGWTNNNYGIIQIPSNTDNKYEWNLKVKHLKYTGMRLGISDSIRSNTYLYNDSDQTNTYYMIWAMGATIHQNINGFSEWSWNVTEIKQNDELSLVLDLKNAEIILSINNSKGKVLFKNVAKSDSIRYRLTVSLHYVGDSLKILDFKQLKN